MPSCRNCGTNVGASDNFCPHCATPQTDEADRRLSEFIDNRATQLGTGGGGSNGGIDGNDLRHRIQYAIGFFAIVVGLSTLTAGSGVFFLLAGVVVLPPVQDALESRLGKPIGPRPTAVAVTALSVLGAASFLVV